MDSTLPASGLRRQLKATLSEALEEITRLGELVDEFPEEKLSTLVLSAHQLLAQLGSLGGSEGLPVERAEDLPSTILIAEDDPAQRAMLRLALSDWGIEVIPVENGEQALEVLEGASPPRLALLDWVMPGIDGMEVVKRLRRRSEPYIYTLLLTAKDGQQDLVSALRGGADDYLMKPFDPNELRARIQVGQRQVALHAELIQAREALRIQATHDPLTGLLNRRAITERLQAELHRSRREKSPLAVILVDLDLFKRINDTHGHEAGDRVLVEAARRMSRATRPYDLLGRYGGEEFLVVLPNCPEAEAVASAERLRSLLCATPVDLPAGPLKVTASLGVGARLADPDEDLAGLLRAADKALYRAKSGGRDRVEAALEADFTPV